MVFAILVSILVAFIMIKLFWGIPDIITTVAKQALGMAQAPQIAGIIMKQASLGALVEKYKQKKQARDNKKQKKQEENDNKERAQDNKDKDKDKSNGNSAGVSIGKGESNA